MTSEREVLMALSAHFLRSAGEVGAKDAVLLGVSGPNKDDDPVRPGEVRLVIVRRVIGGKPYVHAVPADCCDRHPMFGGSFVYSQDSRFRREVCEYPIAVHDRFE